MQKTVVAVVVALIVIAAAWWFWARQNDATAGDTLVLQGNVNIRQIALAFNGTGRITELRAEEGHVVEANEVIGVLDTQALALQVAQAKAQIEVQRQIVLKLRNGARPEEIDQVRSQLASAQAQARSAQSDLTRRQQLFGVSASSVSVLDIENAELAVEVANQKVNEIQAALALTKAGSRSEEIAGAEAQLASAQAQLALLEHQIDEAQLRSPQKAVVRSRLLEPGDMATPQQPVVTLALTDPKWIRLFVSERDLGRVRVNMPASIFTDSQPDQPIAGSVSFISSVAEFTPKTVQTEELRTSLVYEVRVLVGNDDGNLRLGQPVTVRIPLETAP
ncbi:MAG TPA: HlyD family efflux transporter periplasmic adaptor subunit [Devosiaceae bacterium]|jgi:HlyD family secretion protein